MVGGAELDDGGVADDFPGFLRNLSKYLSHSFSNSSEAPRLPNTLENVHQIDACLTFLLY